MVWHTQNRTWATVNDFDRMNLGMSMSAFSNGFSTRYGNQGLLGDVVTQQAASFNGLSDLYGNHGFLGDVVSQPSTSSNGHSGSHGQNYVKPAVGMSSEPVFTPPVTQQQFPVLPEPVSVPADSTSNHTGGLESHGNRSSAGYQQLWSSEPAFGQPVSQQQPLALPKPGFLPGSGLVCDGNRRSPSLVGPSSSMKPPLPKSGFLSGAATSGDTGGLVSRGKAPSVVFQQVPSSSSPSVTCGNRGSSVEKSYANQVKWLVFLKHVRTCSAGEGKCLSDHCDDAKQVLKHVNACTLNKCRHHRCRQTKILFQHYRNCKTSSCPVCVPVRSYIQEHKRKSADISSSASSCHQSTVRTADYIPQKQIKTKHLSAPLSASCMDIPNVAQNTPNCSAPVVSVQVSGKQEVLKMTSKKPPKLVLKTQRNSEPEKDKSVRGSNVKVDGERVGHSGLSKKGSDLGVVQVIETKLQKLKVPGLSLIDFFSADQIQEHLNSLKKGYGNRKSNKNAMECPTNICQLCAAGELLFGTLPLYCNVCTDRIKPNHTFYTVRTGEESWQFCKGCFRKPGSVTIEVNGAAIPKTKMVKRKNDDRAAEMWVECGTCKAWQHQICALFNARRDVGGQAEYTCPICCIGQIARGERKALPQRFNRGAKDLPTTILSDHLEKRLFEKLKNEREQRAKLQGKKMEEVPGAEGLVLRVVSCVDKKLEVLPNFLKLFEDQNYPKDFPCKSKAILLFQEIEGVEVCLFGMFVQEYGSECPAPNQRRVYLSYLDSVKYFRPEIATVTGEALRTFVYHEILIGYLDYCKTRGFTSCYIWACPPKPLDDYILYYHPESQKMPGQDKLKNWYESMIRKAIMENIVVDYTNLYDHFFQSTGEPKAKVTAASLPYFDGDHWPREAEARISELRKRKRNSGVTKRSLKAAGLTNISGNASIAHLLLQSIEESISSRKKDFIMVHLQYACSHCRELMVSGKRWVCQQCKNFLLCSKCHGVEKMLDERNRHPSNKMDKHAFESVEVRDVPVDTKDGDRNLESEFLDTRMAFLGLCQGNYYQNDTLRRAKHSSMMLLYHLHNPTAPWFIPRCIVCHNDVQAGQGWRCKTCKDYDVCNTCFPGESFKHPHMLTSQSSTSDHHSQKSEAPRKEAVHVITTTTNTCFQDESFKHPHMLASQSSTSDHHSQKSEAGGKGKAAIYTKLLTHTVECPMSGCPSTSCLKLKTLFVHTKRCTTHAAGGCSDCKKTWEILYLHSQYCEKSECNLPRCEDLKKWRAQREEMEKQRKAQVAEKINE